MSNKKRVLVLTSTFPRWQGDDEPPFVFELSRRLTDKFDVMILAPHAPGARRHENIGNLEVYRFRYFAPRWEKLAYQGGILANLRKSRWHYLLLPFFFLTQLSALRRILRHQHIDLIHAHWIIPQGLTVAIAGLFSRNLPPMICTSHGGDLMGLRGWLPTHLKRWVIHRSSRLAVVSHAMEKHALSLGAKPDQLRTFPMGVDTSAVFLPDHTTPRKDHQILFVGRLVEKKGCKFLIGAMPEILVRHPDIRLDIVGGGPEQEALKQQAIRLGVAHAITFHGARNNAEIPDLYRQATVFVAPFIVTAQGDQEGLGLVLVEALGCECPVVVSDLPAIRDVVQDGITGLTCQQRNSEALAAKICFLLEHPELRESLGRAGRQHVQENFDWQMVSCRYADLIDDLTQ